MEKAASFEFNFSRNTICISPIVVGEKFQGWKWNIWKVYNRWKKPLSSTKIEQWMTLKDVEEKSVSWKLSFLKYMYQYALSRLEYWPYFDPRVKLEHKRDRLKNGVWLKTNLDDDQTDDTVSTNNNFSKKKYRLCGH